MSSIAPTQANVTEIADHAQYLELVEVVRDAARRYYADGTSLLDDQTYDAHVRGLVAAETLHPDWKVAQSPTELVGAGAEPVAADKAVRHTTPMLSLGNLFTSAELEDWLAGRERMLGRPVSGYLVEPKYDGSACSALYDNGRLVRIATRGDGTTGEDRSYAIDRVKNLPRQLTEPFTGEVRGEVMFRAGAYEAANEARLAAGKGAYANPRNAATGAFGAESLAYEVSLTFMPYGMTGADGVTRHSEIYERLSGLGFSGIESSLITRCSTGAEVAAAVARMSEVRQELDFQIDGAVIKVDLLSEQNELGLASRVPRWGTAFKYPADTAISALEEVLWQVGRTGVITPRARITPTVVGGVEIEYATLHNVTDIERKGFLLGDKVTVLRAGEVIPRLEAPVVSARTGDETPIPVPTQCPRCEGGIDKSQVRWRCERGRNCGLVETLTYAASRDAWDIEGLASWVIKLLVDNGTLHDIGDLFKLTVAELADLELGGVKKDGSAKVLGATRAAKICAQIENARVNAPLARTVTALGIKMTGRSMSRRLASAFGSMDALQSASSEALESVEGVGKERASVIREELDALEPVIAKLRDAGLSMSSGDDDMPPQDLPFSGKTIVISGNLPGYTRTTGNEAIEKLGGKSSGSVSINTTWLVTSETTTSKAVKAAQLGVTLMDPEEFATLLKAHGA